MNTDRIDKLLERYYDALTTEAEEQELKRFFTEAEVPERLQAEKEMFLQMQALADAPVPPRLEERISRSIDVWEQRESHIQKTLRKARILHLQWIGSIAASLLVLIAFGWYMYEPQQLHKDTCATPEEAYIQAQKALTMFSDALNKGISGMEAAHATTERVERSIQKQLNKINE